MQFGKHTIYIFSYICKLKGLPMQTKINTVTQKYLVLTSIWYTSILVLFSGCASLTGYQDGKSVGKGNVEAAISLNFSQSPEFKEFVEPNTVISEITTFGFPNIELAGRYGAFEKLDVTMRLNTYLNAGVGVKYQIVGNRLSDFALGLGAEIGTFGLSYSLWNTQIPLFASFHPNEKFAFYISPRYIFQFSSLGDVKGWNYLGGNIGFLFGSRHKFGIDAGFYSVDAHGVSKVSLSSFGVGGKFVFGNNTPGAEKSGSKKKRKM